MILNERQYIITAKQIRKFELAINEIKSSPIPDDENEKLGFEIQLDGLTSQLEEMQEEIAAYENLKAGNIMQLNLSQLEELPDALIQARIARGLTQEQLAERLGVKAQQVQRDEANKYAGSSFHKILEVKKVLGLEVAASVHLN